MKKEFKLLQGNFCCIWKGKIVYPTEENGVFIEVDPQTSTAVIIDKENLKNRIEFICCDENAIYLVDMAGKWIAETLNGSPDIRYHKLDCTRKTTGNFAFICEYKNEIVLFLKAENTVVYFNKTTKKVSITKYDIKETIQLESGCIKDNCVYLFAGKSKKYYIYSLEKKKIIGQRQMPIEGIVPYALEYKNKIYILSENAVYDVFNDFKEMVKVGDQVHCTKMSMANDTIWLLPGPGEKIYICSMKDGTYRECDTYPADYEYDIQEGWTKFWGKAEDEENIYWCMRAANYFLKIDKHSGAEEWLSPCGDAEQLIEKSFFENKLPVNEGICTLNDFLRHLPK